MASDVAQRSAGTKVLQFYGHDPRTRINALFILRCWIEKGAGRRKQRGQT